MIFTNFEIGLRLAIQGIFSCNFFHVFLVKGNNMLDLMKENNGFAKIMIFHVFFYWFTQFGLENRARRAVGGPSAAPRRPSAASWAGGRRAGGGKTKFPRDADPPSATAGARCSTVYQKKVWNWITMDYVSLHRKIFSCNFFNVFVMKC